MSENRLFLSGEENKYSSAVAIASIVKYLEQFYSIVENGKLKVGPTTTASGIRHALWPAVFGISVGYRVSSPTLRVSGIDV